MRGLDSGEDIGQPYSRGTVAPREPGITAGLFSFRLMTDARSRGPRPAPEPDDREDAPGAPAHESMSSMFRRATAEGARAALEEGSRSLGRSYPLTARLARWLGGGLVFALSGVTASYVVSDDPAQPPAEASQAACDPMVEQHLVHLATAGGELARQLTADGLPHYAELVDAMTDVDQLPDDLKLCILLSRKQHTGATAP